MVSRPVQRVGIKSVSLVLANGVLTKAVGTSGSQEPKGVYGRPGKTVKVQPRLILRRLKSHRPRTVSNHGLAVAHHSTSNIFWLFLPLSGHLPHPLHIFIQLGFKACPLHAATLLSKEAEQGRSPNLLSSPFSLPITSSLCRSHTRPINGYELCVSVHPTLLDHQLCTFCRPSLTLCESLFLSTALQLCSVSHHTPLLHHILSPSSLSTSGHFFGPHHCGPSSHT